MRFMKLCALSAVVLLFGAGLAKADNLVNELAVLGTNTIVSGDAGTVVKYKINATGGSCDVADGSSATVNFSIPSGVGTSAPSLVFSACNVFQSVTYTATKPGVFNIDVASIVDTAGSFANHANFTLSVRPRPATELGAVANGSDQIDLTWKRSPDHANLTKYVLDDGSASTLLDPAAAAGTTQAYPVTGLEPETEYCFTITSRKTVSSTDLDSTATSQACATTGAETPPNTAPSVSVTGVIDGATYELGSVPAAGCSVTDTEDGHSGATDVVSPSVDGSALVNGLGDVIVSCSYTDDGGLPGDDSVTYTIEDTTDPVVGVTLDPSAPHSSGWYRQDVSATISATDLNLASVEYSTDGGSTWTPYTGAIDFTTESAAHQLRARATDHSGNEGSASTSFKLDKSAPTDVVLTPAGTIGDNDWYVSDVTITATGNEDVSTPLVCDGPQSLTSDSSGTQFNGKCTNDAGLETSAEPITVKRDTIKPVVTLTCPTAPVIRESTATASWEATDATSLVVGADEGTVPLNTSTVGSHTGYAPAGTARDNAGHVSAQSTCSYTVVYDWDGFRSPIENPEEGEVSGTWVSRPLNKVKAGSSVPLKFSLEGFYGFGVVTSVKTDAVNCNNFEPDPNGPIDASTTTANAGLTYDGSIDQYNYVWKTVKGQTGCHRLTMTLSDTSKHIAFIQFTK